VTFSAIGIGAHGESLLAIMAGSAKLLSTVFCLGNLRFLLLCEDIRVAVVAFQLLPQMCLMVKKDCPGGAALILDVFLSKGYSHGYKAYNADADC
jgi:hypothetical protein